ncbi:hypothetical protein HKL94_02740 [Candidatus Parcubacteria bacterium]|nr:hypothetical protein [Candidatus Parcubacteria bacterium]
MTDSYFGFFVSVIMAVLILVFTFLTGWITRLKEGKVLEVAFITIFGLAAFSFIIAVTFFPVRMRVVQGRFDNWVAHELSPIVGNWMPTKNTKPFYKN